MKFNPTLVLVLLAAITISNAPAFALQSTDLSTVTGGVVKFDTATKTTTAITNPAANSVMEANWNNLNVGVGETLTNSFSATGQTLVHRVIGNDLSTIAGTINSIGIGATTGKVVLINPNGIIFNGATVNVAGLLVSSLNTTAVLPNQINVLGGLNKNIQIYNSTITTPKGSAFVTNGSIDVRNSTLRTAAGDTGNIQLITADGVNFKYSDGGAKLRWVVDSAHYSFDSKDSKVTAKTTTGESQISVSKSTIEVFGTAKQESHVLLSTNSNYAGNSDVIVFGSSTIKAPNGAISITAYNKNNNYGNVKIYKDITPTDAKNIDFAGTKSVLTQKIKVPGSVIIRYKPAITGTPPADLPDVLTIPEQEAAAAAEAARLASQSNKDDPQKYLPKANAQPALAMKTPSTFAGAAAKINKKQSPNKFIGLVDDGSKKIKYYELLK